MRKQRKEAVNTPLTPGQDVWRRLRRNKAAMFGLVVIILIILAAIFADVIADYDTQVIGTNPDERLIPPCAEHIFGTDAAGRDIFARVVHGARYSLSFGLLCAVLALVLGAALGASAAFFGGKVDLIITFIIDAVTCIPGMLLSLSLVAVLGTGFTNLIIAITVTAIPSYARIIRSIVLGIVRQEYIEAARAIGVSSARTIFVHVLPNAIGLIIVNVTMNIAGLIMSAAGL